MLSKAAAEVKVYRRQTWNFRSHALSACISLWCHRSMHAPHRLMHACTACIAPWCHRLMHAVTAWALLFWFHLRFTFISSYSLNVVNCATQISKERRLLKAYKFPKIPFKRVLVVGTNMAGGLSRQAGWVNRCALFSSQYFYGGQ
jgi:hypothetical protein